MIIIGDIHGRTYWKHALTKAGVLNQDGILNEEVLFLGDYLDHYPSEPDPYNENMYITSDGEVENFKEILNLKKRNDGKVELLLGNHDVEYFCSNCPDCRMNGKHYNEIRNLFLENLDLFDLGFHSVVDGKNVTFSHANITYSYLQTVGPLLKQFGYDYMPNVNDGMNSVLDFIAIINSILNKVAEDPNNENLHKLGTLLCQVGPGRGGYSNSGSIVWADLYDFLQDERFIDDCPDQNKDCWNDHYQIVGHTQHIVKNGKFVCAPQTICLDCHIEALGKRPIFRLSDSFHPIENAFHPTCVEIVEF